MCLNVKRHPRISREPRVTFKQLKTSAERIDSRNANLCQAGNRSMVLLLKKERGFTGTLITCLSCGLLYQREKIISLYINPGYNVLLTLSKARLCWCLFKVFSVSCVSSKFRPSGVGLKAFQNLVLSHISKLILPW